MPYSTSTPGVREALTFAVQGLLIAKIADLQAALTTIPPTITGLAAVSAGQFYVGDFDKLPDPTANPWWVTLCKGGRADGRDAEISLYASSGVFEKVFWTNLYFYLHPLTFKSMTDPVAQAQTREVLRSRFEDWLLDDVLCTLGNLTFPLASKTYAPPAFDTVDQCYVRAVTDGYETKSYGNTQDVQTVHFEFQSVVRGAV